MYARLLSILPSLSYSILGPSGSRQGYRIPPIICATSRHPGRTEHLTRIDGKQRCMSINSFVPGVIPFVSPENGKRCWYIRRAGSKRQRALLPDDLQQRFERVTLSMVEYRGISDAQQRDFSGERGRGLPSWFLRGKERLTAERVQLGVPPRSSEKLGAISSPWAKWIDIFRRKYILEPGTLGTVFKWLQNQDRALLNLAGFVHMAFTSSNRCIPSQTTLTMFLSQQAHSEFKRKVENALDCSCVSHRSFQIERSGL